MALFTLPHCNCINQVVNQRGESLHICDTNVRAHANWLFVHALYVAWHGSGSIDHLQCQ